jgi:hypothetical protein
MEGGNQYCTCQMGQSQMQQQMGASRCPIHGDGQPMSMSNTDWRIICLLEDIQRRLIILEQAFKAGAHDTKD